MAYCDVCIYSERETDDLPCKNCIFGDGIFDYFVRIKKSPEQPTIPPMPPVNTPKKETNRPLRIDVMADIFGVEATKHFCLLNAFKCLWGAEAEKSKEDVENAAWYLNEYIRLGGEDK